MSYEKIQNVVTLYKKDENIRKILEKAEDDGNDLCEYAIKGMDYYQLTLINICLKEKLDVSQIDNINLSYEQMNELLDGMRKGIDVHRYADPTLTPIEMYGATVSELTSKNTKKYFLEDFNDDQLYEILSGLEAGLDVSTYSKIELSADEMREIRLQLQKRKNSSNTLQKIAVF